MHDVAMTWIVKGSGQIQIEIGAPRTGWRIHKLDVGR